jgi:small subunit ribosomal protein S2
MALPHFTMRQLLEAGVHFGHTTRRWNPKMAPFLFGVRNGVHIIDLEQTVPLLHQSLVAVRDIVAAGGRVLFVGTKRQASDLLADSAKRCGQYYVNHRWLGGMMTNWKTISNSIKRLQVLEDQLAKEDIGLTKKELLNLTRERDKLDRALGGIKEMGGLPDVLVVIDTNKEHIAVKEAVILGIPVVGVVDSNSDPEGVTYPVPGNDDATRAIRLYCDLLADAVLDGIQVEVAASGADVGEAEEGPQESLPAEGEVAQATAEAAPAEEQAAKTSTEEQAAEAPADKPATTEVSSPDAAKTETAASKAEEVPAAAETEAAEAPASGTEEKGEAPAAEETGKAAEAPASGTEETGEAPAAAEPAKAEEKAGA